MTGTAHRQRVVLAEGLHNIAGVVFNLVQVGDQQVDFAALQTCGQLLPGCQHHLQMHAGVRAVQMASTGATRAAPANGPTPHATHLAPSRAPIAGHAASPGVQQQLPGMLQQQLAHRSGGHFAVAAIKQLLANLRFQRLQAAGQRRLGEVQRLCGAGKVAMFGQGQGMTQVTELYIHAFRASRK